MDRSIDRILIVEEAFGSSFDVVASRRALIAREAGVSEQMIF
jgi:hypothetical protein